MPNLRRQLFVMLRTMDNVAIFFSLLILFIFIFRWVARPISLFGYIDFIPPIDYRWEKYIWVDFTSLFLHKTLVNLESFPITFNPINKQIISNTPKLVS